MKKILAKIGQFFKFIYEEMIKFPAYILVHPLKGFEEFKRYKKGKVSVALAFIVLAIILNISKYQFTGASVQIYKISDLKSGAQIVYILGAVLIVTVANWSVTTLFDGKGNMRDIFLMTSYCLYPYIWGTLVGMILSNVLATDEVALYTLVIGLGVFLMIYMFFMGIISIHEYGLGQCLLTILFTIVAALIILFAGVLVFDLFQKIYGFFYQIYQEISLRGII